MYDVKSCDSTTDASDALLLLVHVVIKTCKRYIQLQCWKVSLSLVLQPRGMFRTPLR